MKYKSIITVILAMVLLIMPAIKSEAQKNLKGKITLSGAWALYPMAVKWAEEFKKLNPGVSIDISAGGAGKGLTDAVSGLVDIGMVSRDVYVDEIKKGAYPFAVAKDAVVAVVSASNPAIKNVLSKGLTKDAATKIWITGDLKSWGQLYPTSPKAPIHVYTRSDACGAAETWAKFTGKKQEDLQGSGVYGDPGIALAVKKDQLGIGFNNLGYAYDLKTKKQLDGLKIVPIDINNNGKIDADENFYDTVDKLEKAIAAGKYPSPPTRNLYFVTKGKPNGVTSAFIKWVLTDGQKFVTENGFINLPKDKLKAESQKL